MFQPRFFAFLALLGLAAAMPARADEQECVSCWTAKCRNLKDFGMPACKAAAPARPDPVPTAPPRRKDARLSVDTVPGGLVVLIDGRPAGQGPLPSRTIAPGDHEVSVQADACHTAAPQWVYLGPGEERAVTVTAQNATATIELQANDGSRPSGKVEIDGQYAGYGPGPLTVSACARELHLTTSDGRSAWAYLSLTAGGRSTVKVTLPSATGPSSTTVAQTTSPAVTPTYTPPAYTPPAYNAPPPQTQSPEAVLEAACRAGSMKNCAALGTMYLDGDGVPQDYVKAAGALETACHGGELAACTDLGSMYADGNGVSRDVDRAKELFQQACDGGYKRGCNAKETLDQGPHNVDPPPSSQGFCGSLWDDIFDGGSYHKREHGHPLLGLGLNWSAPEKAWQFTFGGLMHSEREDFAAGFLVSYETLGAQTDSSDPVVVGYLNNLSMTVYQGAAAGPFLFMIGYELNHASADENWTAVPLENVNVSPGDVQAVRDNASGWAMGLRATLGLSFQAGPVHLAVLAGYRGIWGPLKGGGSIDVLIGPEGANCAD